jgi:hypothetical protein
VEEYLTSEHPDAFIDFPEILKPQEKYGYTKLCCVCKGHGGWNLKLNAYKLHNMENTAENRHKYSHFRAGCSHCNSWGYVQEDEMCDGHNWVFNKTISMCYTEYKCSKCSKISTVDSSD